MPDPGRCTLGAEQRALATFQAKSKTTAHGIAVHSASTEPVDGRDATGAAAQKLWLWSTQRHGRAADLCSCLRARVDSAWVADCSGLRKLLKQARRAKARQAKARQGKARRGEMIYSLADEDEETVRPQD